MTQKTQLIGLMIVLLLGTTIAMYKLYSPSAQDSETGTEVSIEDQNDVANNQDKVPPTFTWSFEEADTLNLDGMPETDIFLKVTDTDGEVERKLIDTTPGSCNTLPEADLDSVPDTTNVQCYSAGLGYRFKITEDEGTYQVERQTFEEAMPDYMPPPYEYEVVAEFRLTS